MLLRPTVLALALVVGAAAAAHAQSDEFPFRRFRIHAEPRIRFSFDKFDRALELKNRVEVRKQLGLERSLALRERARDRQWEREFDARNRRFELQDRAHQRALELKLRGLDRFKERFDRFKIERPIRIKRNSRII